MTLEIRAQNSWLQTGSSISGNLTGEPMRQVEDGLIGSDVEISDNHDSAVVTIPVESAGPTERSNFLGSEALPEGVSRFQ